MATSLQSAHLGRGGGVEVIAPQIRLEHFPQSIPLPRMFEPDFASVLCVLSGTAKRRRSALLGHFSELTGQGRRNESEHFVARNLLKKTFGPDLGTVPRYAPESLLCRSPAGSASAFLASARPSDACAA